MAKKKSEKKSDTPNQQIDQLQIDIPDETKKKLEAIKEKLDQFQKKLLEKFDNYIMGIALLPPEKDDKNKEKINTLVLIDDSDSQKMSKEELKEKLTTIIAKMAEDIDKNLNVETIILTELWQSCYDAKYDLLQMIAMSAPVFDKGMLAAIKIAEIHKTMVLKKFEKYIVSYVLAGSLVQGRATPESDIDVFIVIDDTDVKKMTRAELKDKLRAIIIGMGIDAGKMTGIENKLNVQVYILTDFWENIKEANPIIFTFLRDGVPFYDRGIFMPWKQLLHMGRVKPSPEAIEMFKSTGEQMIERVKLKIKDIGMEDLFYAILTPSQAALMMYGVPPPTPKETPDVLTEVFVEKDKLLEKEYVDILKRNIKVRKDMEHGTKKELSGKELDVLLSDAEKYLKRLNKLFEQIETLKEEESVLHTYESVVTIIRDILRLEGIERVKDTDIITVFGSEVINKGLIPEKFLRVLKTISKAKKDYDAKKLTKTEIHKVMKEGRELIKFLVEYIQRKRGRELERTKIRVKHGKKYGEVILLGKEAYIIHDIDNDDKDISKAEITEKGSLGSISKSNLEELEKALAAIEIPEKAFIKEPIFEDLKNIFGKDVEILINY
ncbi:MAG: nucleotidyltransferase domain-containing protein [Nanoarchaeota archaeon]|nr:nucleotidyltransferase domain-containing protein [Nanoarchaeota archaeon]MBU1029909.1 nucleotidyltransferase domain-containing protein [Nanoarchaeota archaeon]MBU1850399.1 nucleotidyltransferase domain-containing protein [Nanoarchaeota archaeon]